MLRVLIIGDNPFRLQEQLLLCEKLLIINPEYSFTFLIVNKHLAPFFLDKSKRITFHLIGQKKNIKQTNNLDILKRIPFVLSEMIIFFLAVIDLYKNYFRLKKMMNNLKPHIVISNKDSNTGIEPIILKIAKEKKIKVVIPYMAYSDNIGIAELYSRRNNKEKSESFFTKFIMKLFPQQVTKYKNNKFLFYSPSFTLAYKFFGALSKNPWIIGHGLSDLICVDTLHTYNRYKDYKIPEKKLRIVGDVIFDQLFNNFNKKNIIKELFTHKYHLNKRKKNIIISLPQLTELGLISPESSLNEIHFILQSLQEINCNVLISLHPRMHLSDYQFLEKIYNCKILTERLFEVISIADLFISTYSSTVIWSVLSKVPTIITDFNRLDYTMYNFLQTVTVVTKKTELKKIIEKNLKVKMDFTYDWNCLSRDTTFDGKTIQRYNDLFIRI